MIPVIRRCLCGIGIALILLFIAALAAPAIVDGLRSYSIIESLSNAREVTRINPDGLQLADGQFVSWNIGSAVPSTMAILHAAVDGGVDVDSNGNVIGLLKLWHWCGNDPVRRHVARVDLRQMLQFLGGRSSPGADEPLDFTTADSMFESRYGWNVSEWWDFQRWRGGDPGRIYR